MPIITISRGTFAGGERLAALLGERLGYRSVSREMLYARVTASYGFAEEELQQIMTFTPSRLDQAHERRRRLFVSIQAALCDLIKDDQAVYHGHAGHLLLPGIVHVLRVRLIAPRSKRLRMAMEREGISAQQASGRIDQVDAERARWTEFVFGANWADPALYDVVLNLERMELDEAADVVVGMVRLPSYQASPASTRELADLALSSAVTAHLLADPTTASLEVKVTARAGQVTLAGLSDPRRLDQALAVARRVPGVTAAAGE